ncbi:MAG: HAMP domain-containing histidine kinase [Bacteroidales bacterium]|nr:HAMP domain-containing histidine kinase [Bacteroidales bacterium]
MAGSLAQDALQHIWLRPAWSALEALTADRPNLGLLSMDPGITLHCVRSQRPRSAQQFVFDSTFILQPMHCALAARWLTADAKGYSDWTQTPHAAHLCQIGQRIASVAARLATTTGNTSPAAAWVTGLLTPLGWYALCAVHPTATEIFAHSPQFVQTLTRQLTARQRLPAWLAATLGWLTLPVQDAEQLGADAGLFPIVQAAVHAVCRADVGTPLFAEIPDDARNPTLTTQAVDLQQSLAKPTAPRIPSAWAQPTIPPSTIQVMVRLLHTTAQLREATQTSDAEPLEKRIDQLETYVSTQQHTLAERVQEARLRGLAEFAAGASHEINNPLMIILGNSRILAEEEVDADRIERFASIARSTHRISELLAKTRLFARPPLPRPEAIQLADWLPTIAVAWERIAAEHSVQFTLEWGASALPDLVLDPHQLQQALTQIVQNAVEAVEPDGWVRMSLSAIGNTVRFVIADSGPGPDAEIRDQLFDPFFCGRAAGRHPGMGLPVAWRLVQQNGGQLRFAPTEAQPSRFELHFPVSDSQNRVIRKSA